MFCACLTWFLILYAEFVVIRVILWQDIHSLYSMINSVLYVVISGLAVASHLRTMLSDPVSSQFFHELRFYISLLGCCP